MAKKKTSARVAKLAGKYAAMTGMEMHDERLEIGWPKFCANVRALAASVLSQTESKTKVKRK